MRDVLCACLPNMVDRYLVYMARPSLKERYYATYGNPVNKKRKSQAFTRWQIDAIADCQQEHHALATKIAAAAGLRPHELLSLRKAEERPADPQPCDPNKFKGRNGALYTVIGKFGFSPLGGAWRCRSVLIPKALAANLEQLRREEPFEIISRGTSYLSLYTIGGGRPWSASFSRASDRALLRPAGATGLRHTYAQERLSELQLTAGISYLHALSIIAQEMGLDSTESVENMLV